MQICCRRVARNIEIRSEDDLVRTLVFDPLNQLLNLELLGTNPFDRRDRPVKHVIPPFELPGALERQDIQWLFHDTDRGVTTRVGTDCAGIILGDVETARTKTNALFDFENCFG